MIDKTVVVTVETVAAISTVVEFITSSDSKVGKKSVDSRQLRK